MIGPRPILKRTARLKPRHNKHWERSGQRLARRRATRKG